MMKNRKRIAVIMGNVMCYDCQQRILEGLIAQAFALNYDVVVFTMFMNEAVDKNYLFGENKIFTLIDYDMFDAVIYAPCSFNSQELNASLQKELAGKCHVPIAALESRDSAYHNINVDETSAYAQLVSHLIEEHGLKRIMCLTGFPDNFQAESRLKGYRTAMAAHGLDIPEGYIIYGDFWTQAATELADALAERKIPLPEAVVCVSDKVAVTLCNRLTERGIRVPEDIVIAGYDATQEAADNVPSVTSYVRPMQDMGMRAVLRIHELLTGEHAAPVSKDQGFLVPEESCGCRTNSQKKSEKRQARLRDSMIYRQLFDDCPMAEVLNSTTTFQQLLTHIIGFLYLISSVQDFYLCLCDQWDMFSPKEQETELEEKYKNYTDTMHLRIRCENAAAIALDETFSRSELLPALHEEREKPRAYYITPLHFNQRCFGYTALSYGDMPMAFDSVYHYWIRNINNALEFMRVRTGFTVLNKRLYIASIRDPLTGLYNRKGFEQFAEDIFSKARATHQKILVMAVDLDCLKVINDTYGHLEGDSAISAIGTALNTCFEFGEICARTGGDEFVAIGMAEYTEDMPEHYARCIRRFLDRYNATSGKPYKVGASIGYFCTEVQEDTLLQNLLEEADSRMYRNKVKRKKIRQ
jgi:diguanylate cyclase (GGDEF)-like protein